MIQTATNSHSRNKVNKLVIFHLDEQHFALQLLNVKQILPSIEIHPLPMAPDHISGVINYHGEFLPVVNMRKLFRLSEREIELCDQFIIAGTDKIRLVLWVDAVDEILTLTDEEIGDTNKILIDFDCVDGHFKLHNKLVLINDPDKFIAPDQIIKLKEAIQKLSENQE